MKRYILFIALGYCMPVLLHAAATPQDGTRTIFVKNETGAEIVISYMYNDTKHTVHIKDMALAILANGADRDMIHDLAFFVLAPEYREQVVIRHRRSCNLSRPTLAQHDIRRDIHNTPIDLKDTNEDSSILVSIVKDQPLGLNLILYRAIAKPITQEMLQNIQHRRALLYVQ